MSFFIQKPIHQIRSTDSQTFLGGTLCDFDLEIFDITALICNQLHILKVVFCQSQFNSCLLGRKICLRRMNVIDAEKNIST